MKKVYKRTASEKTNGKLKVERDVLKQKPPCNSNSTQKEIILNQLLQSLLRHIATNFIAKKSFVKFQFRNSNSYFGWLSSNGLNRFGTYSFETGAYFKGTFEESLSKGIGSLTYSNGDIYEGEFLAGLPHGYGHYKSERLKYNGYFKNGKFHGKGILKTKAEEIEGLFYMGKIQSGKACDHSGTFNGTFDKLAMRHNGIFTFKNGNTYNGSWANNQYMGFGEYKWNGEEQSSMEMKTKYLGYWWNGKQHSLGMLKFNLRSLICQWSYGRKNGAGIIISCTGSCYCSENLFVADQYKESHCIRNCQESREIVSEAFNILTFTSKYESMEEKMNAFLGIVKSLLKEYSICASPINPLRISDYDILPAESLTSSLESRHLQQVLVENYTIFENLYKKYTQPIDECMNDFGLNLFYIDVFCKVRDLNVLECLNAGQSLIRQSLFHSDEKYFNNLITFVPFYEFFQHFIHVTEVLMENEELKSKANEMRPTFFGHLAIRVLFVLKMLETNTTPLFLVREGIRLNFHKFVKLSHLMTEMFSGENSIRTAYKVLKLKQVVEGKSSEFLDTVNTFFGVKCFDLFDDCYKLSQLELIEIILRTCQYKLQQNLQCS